MPILQQKIPPETGGDFICKELAVHVVVLVQLVHSLEHLVQVNQRADADQATQNVPQPEGACAEVIGDTTTLQFATDTVGNSVIPNDTSDTAGDGSYDEHQQAEVHGLLAIVSGSNNVDLVGYGRHNYQGVNTAGNDGQQNGLQQTLIGLQLAYGRSVYSVFHNFHLSFSLTIILHRTEPCTVYIL